MANKTKPARGRADFFRYVCDNLPPNASTFYWRQTAANELFAASLKKTPHSDSKTAPAQTPIDNNKKTPTSDNVSELEAPLHPKPPCKCMCPLEQRTSGPFKPEWTPEVVDGRVASKPPKKKTTPHSDTKTAPVLTTIDDDVTLRRCAPRRPEGARRPPPGSLALS